MYIFELEDTYQFNSIIIAVADTYEDAVIMYLDARFGSRALDHGTESVRLIKRHNIVPGIITWKDD